MDSPAPKVALGQYVRNETRYRMVEQADPERFKHLLAAAQREVDNRYEAHANLARLTMPVRTVAEMEDK
jgi:pyruvate-ferredoxin/flavodoxin oxidoreductase